MRAVLLCVLVAFVASAVAIKLPPGFNSATELASVLANEPDAARFASVNLGGSGDSITFKDDSSSSPSSGGGGGGHHEEDEADVSDIDAQVEQINSDLKKLKEAIKESEECARRLTEQQAEVRSLQEQKDHLEKEKEKRILQSKLEKQMKDLAEINRMSRSLRTKFAELKHTQKLIKTKMSGTRSSLSQLDNDSEPVDSSALSEASENLGTEVDAMQKAQTDILARIYDKNTAQVKSAIKSANDLYKNGPKDD